MARQVGVAPNGGVILETDDGRRITTTPEAASRFLGPVQSPPGTDIVIPGVDTPTPPVDKSRPRILGKTSFGTIVVMPNGEEAIMAASDAEDLAAGRKPMGQLMREAGEQGGHRQREGIASTPLPLAPSDPRAPEPVEEDKGWRVGEDGKLVRTSKWNTLSSQEQRKVLEVEFPAAREAAMRAPEEAVTLRPPSDFVGGAAGSPGGGGPSGVPGIVSTAIKASSSVPSFQPRGGGGVSGRGLERAFSRQQDAVANSAQLAAQRAQTEAAYLEEQTRQAEVRAGEQMQREEQRAQFITDEEDKVRALMQEATKDTEEVDPNRWWESRSTGQKVLAGISAFLSGFGGGPDHIRQAIRDDIALQKEAIANRRANRKEAAANQMTLLGLARQRFTDERQADLAAEATAMQLAQQRLQAILARTGSQEALARGQELNAQLEVAKQQTLAELGRHNEAMALQRAGLQMDAARLALSAQSATREAQQKGGALFVPMENVPGGGMMALSENDAKELKETSLAFGPAKDKLDRLIALRKEFGGETLPTDTKKMLESLGAELMGDLNRMNKFGALDRGALDVLEKVIGGDITTHRDILPALMSVKKSLNDGWQRAVFTRTGQRPGASSFTPGPERR